MSKHHFYYNNTVVGKPSITRPQSLALCLASRKPAVNLEAYNIGQEAASIARASLGTARAGSQGFYFLPSLTDRKAPGKPIGPVCDCPAFTARPRVFTASEREAQDWLKNKQARQMAYRRPRKDSRLARLAQRLA